MIVVDGVKATSPLFFMFPCTYLQFHVTLYFLPLESQSKFPPP